MYALVRTTCIHVFRYVEEGRKEGRNATNDFLSFFSYKLISFPYAWICVYVFVYVCYFWDTTMAEICMNGSVSDCFIYAVHPSMYLFIHMEEAFII